LPHTPHNNNKSNRADSEPYISTFSRKRSGTSLTLPPLDHRAYVRAKRGGRVRTVPTSRVSSSKLSGPDPIIGKRSRSANNKQGKAIKTQNLNSVDTGRMLGSDWLAHLDVNQGNQSRSDNGEPEQDNPLTDRIKSINKHKNELENIGRRRLSKVETVRVLRARSALLQPLTSPPLDHGGMVPMPKHPQLITGFPSHFQPLLLKPGDTRPEDKKKKRR